MRGIPSALKIAISVAAIAVVSCSQTSDDDRWTDRSPHRVSDLSANGLRLQYLTWGGNGDPVVFVHGSGDSPHYFDEIAPALVANHRVIALARRGHGQSEVQSIPFLLDDLTDHLVDLLDALHLERLTLVGFSFGGNEITRFAERYPARVSRLVYLDAALEGSRPRASRCVRPPAELASACAIRSRFAEVVPAVRAEGLVPWHRMDRHDGSRVPRLFRSGTERQRDDPVRPHGVVDGCDPSRLSSKLLGDKVSCAGNHA